MQQFRISPLEIVRSLRRHRGLVAALVRRDVIGRYRGSAMGLAWSFFNPMLMLLVYTIVFSTVFKARWPGGSDSKTEFALVLFSGLMVFNLFSECVNRAPTLILGNANFVKKVVFPLELLPFVSLGSALFHFAISLVVWLAFYLLFFGVPSATLVLLPVVALPLILMTLGICWLLASLGTYLRDVGQVIGVVTTMLMFLSPIFYPVSALPADYQLLLHINPLTYAVEKARAVSIWGGVLDWSEWIGQFALGVLFAWLGFAWFQKTRKGFSDVL